MPKLVTGLRRSDLRLKRAASGTCMQATFMGAMEYQCVTPCFAMACSTATGSKRNSSTCVAPTRIGVLTPISMPAMW